MRRKKTLKFHAIAIGTICAVVIVLFLLMGPKPGEIIDPNIATGDRYVRIISASWGLNCNAEIARLRKQGMATTNVDGVAKPLEPVQPNNVLYTLTERCDGKITCNILAVNSTLELDPLPTCFKQLVVNYRCFSIDRQWRKQLDQGENYTIDCNEAADKDRK